MLNLLKGILFIAAMALEVGCASPVGSKAKDRGSEAGEKSACELLYSKKLNGYTNLSVEYQSEGGYRCKFYKQDSYLNGLYLNLNKVFQKYQEDKISRNRWEHQKKIWETKVEKYLKSLPCGEGFDSDSDFERRMLVCISSVQDKDIVNAPKLE